MFSKSVNRIYFKIVTSIAFYPVLICIGFVILSFLLLGIQQWAVFQFISDRLDFLIVKDFETARTILSTLIGGILSLMVFSFSMVMLVLNQASSNFSPRLLPGLISDKKHQLILGLYSGTLLYCVLVLIAVGGKNATMSYVGFATMISAILGIICVITFVYFIHMISTTIQIDNIVDTVFLETKRIFENIKKHHIAHLDDNEDWHPVFAKDTGYYRGYDEKALRELMQKNENAIEITIYEDKQIWEGSLLAKTRDPLDTDQLEKVSRCMTISPDRHHGMSYFGGLSKLMEVAVKSLSPGINDPRTAVDIINKLGQLIHMRLKLPTRIKKFEDKEAAIVSTLIDVNDLFSEIIQPIRHYGRNDLSVCISLANLFDFLSAQSQKEHITKHVIANAIENLARDVATGNLSEIDKTTFSDLINLNANN
ncbi:DUF2254 domain-containing protein [Sungkyunkwania multivorans]|uniref:DUF2254 domain-containing protein n=1 Tax=Sungkyunkwania multivorans TaxID=1173618 RepID=A0ABW3CSH4_9FLAO